MRQPNVMARESKGGLGRPARAAAFLLSVLSLATRTATAAGPLEYNRDIRPILSENCFSCHGPDSASRKADLRLDRREAAVEAGGITPGDPENSEVVVRVESTDPEEVMPPPTSTKKLTAAQKETLRRWVASGAEYQPHWSLIAPKRAEPPAVRDGGWGRNPIDRFVLAGLEQRGLKPAPEADRRTLARRLSLDLTGLPPAPADVEVFVADTSSDSYEKFVDRLMASPRWGEHRGRYWLDAARYADTHGIHFDNYREMWSYRDWVINAFNANLPFDRFTTEQLAGDLLPDRTLEQQVASGFNRCNITTNEGGVIDEEYLVLYTRDRTETVSQVWLGLTAGCAVCHDHKFDPISQREFYEMAAFFNNNAQRAMDGNAKDTPPAVVVPTPEDRARWDALSAEIDAAKKKVDARKGEARHDFEKWLAGATPESLASMMPVHGLRLHAQLNRRDASAVESIKGDAGNVLELAGEGDFEKDRAFSYGAWVKLSRADQNGAVLARLDNKRDYRGWDLLFQEGRPVVHIVSKWPGDSIKVEAKEKLKPGEWSHVFVTYDGSAKADGVTIYINGTPQPRIIRNNSLKGSIRTEVPLKVGQRDSSDRLEDALLHDLRVYGRLLSEEEVDRLSGTAQAIVVVAKPAEKRTESEKNELFQWWLSTTDKTYQSLRANLATLEKEGSAIKARGTVALVMRERDEPAMAYLLQRGEYDKRRDPVKPDTIDALPPMPPDAPKNRLGFAQWLLRPDHPLTARVTVNRFWQELFGTGLVRTAGDFGITGELPSHPELLDWMAVEFRESGWDVKRFFKLLVTSASYRQSAVTTPEKLEKDPANRLISRGPRFRMDAEMVRDYALSSSGLLAAKVGGPSVKPYQPDGVWEAVAMPPSNTREYRRDSGEKLYRRSLYTFWKRAAPPASMDIFNAPSRETCTVRRERTNTPLQALVTLNDPQFVEAARHLAQVTLKEGGDATEGRLGLLASRLLARPLRPEEVPVVQASLDALLSHYRSHPEDAAKLIAVGEFKADPALDPPTLAAWTMLSNELLNLDEVLNK